MIGLTPPMPTPAVQAKEPISLDAILKNAWGAAAFRVRA